MARLGMVLFSSMTIVIIIFATQLFTSFRQTPFRDLLLVSIPDEQQQQYIPYRLEYIHIPKTSGTMLEELAGTHNVTWGACHFQSFVLQSKKGETWKTYPPWPSCPSLSHSVEWPSNITNPWHLPLYLLSHYVSFDPYDITSANATSATQLQQQQERPKRFFTVVRNPYDRIISLYYYMRGFNKTFEEMNDPGRLDDFILSHIKDKARPQAQACLQHDTTCHGMFAGSRQYDYVHLEGRHIVHHVLHWESLQEEFAQLSDAYQLGFAIDNKAPVRKRRILTAANLSANALGFINHYYKEDFKLGRGYEMRLPTEDEMEKQKKKKMTSK